MPDVKFILCEPFVLKGAATKEDYDMFLKVREYAKVVKLLAEEYSVLATHAQKGLPAFGIYGHEVQEADDTSIPADCRKRYCVLPARR